MTRLKRLAEQLNYNSEGRAICPECGSEDMRFSQRRYTAAGTPRVQLQCNDCHKYHTVSNRIYENKVANETDLID